MPGRGNIVWISSRGGYIYGSECLYAYSQLFIAQEFTVKMQLIFVMPYRVKTNREA